MIRISASRSLQCLVFLSLGSPLLAGVLPVAFQTGSTVVDQGDPRATITVHEAMHHLGDSKVENWPDGVPNDPEGKQLEFSFDAKRSDELRCFVIRHHHVDNDWDILLNGKKVALLRRRNELGDYLYPISGRAFVDGKNTMAIVPRKPTDDITVGRVRLYVRPLREALRLGVVEVRVRDEAQRAIPARITITDEHGNLPEVYFADSDSSAARPGIVYTTADAQRFELPAGKYQVDVSRGSEWSRASANIDVEAAGTSGLTLSLRHEVDTTGFVAADTHIHTYEFSGHGDASLVERLVTLAGEGVELAISTDHNHNIDYRPEQARLGLSEYYTSVVGNEVTTSMGHFNAFPLDPKDKVPEHRLADWIKVVDGIRAKGARVVILNHPRWPDIEKGPFGRFRLNRLSGERASGPRRLTFDAMELVNATTKMEDPLFLFRDWFALLNHGETVLAVGSSDSHTVGDPVGQGRTYVPSKTDDPARIDVDAACDAFKKGRTTIGMGIFCDLRVGEDATCGDTFTVLDRRVAVRLRVAAPSWVRPRLAHVFVNGVSKASRELAGADGATDTWLDFEVETAPHDGWLVCVVTGDPIREPFWKTLNGYTLAATNPVWLDVDGTPGYSNPLATAEQLLARVGKKPERVAKALARVDDAVAIQALSLVRTSFPRENRYEAFASFVDAMGPDVSVAQRYLATLVEPEPAKAEPAKTAPAKPRPAKK
ncbi:MAG: CehA/McbA family metallohydrolase [Planctomycetes bacterium]|nr:CehA/McbA family metallohydrolase [Planctomycetota bacterium]MCB9919377.1 CehA/McbA family metallohydrolase [Planctomycetota bacterium]